MEQVYRGAASKEVMRRSRGRKSMMKPLLRMIGRMK